MPNPETLPLLVPPPPAPPVGRIAAGGQEPDPFRSGMKAGFIHEALAELKQLVWPKWNYACSAVVVTTGLLSFFAVYMYALNATAGAVFQALGLYAK